MKMENDYAVYRISRIEYDNKSDFLNHKRSETFLEKLWLGAKSIDSIDKFLLNLAKEEGFTRELKIINFNCSGLNKNNRKYRRYYVEKILDFMLIND